MNHLRQVTHLVRPHPGMEVALLLLCQLQKVRPGHRNLELSAKWLSELPSPASLHGRYTMPFILEVAL